MSERGPHVRVHLAIVLVLAIALSAAVPGVASADDARVVRRGQCSGPSHWKLGVRRESRRVLRVRFEVEGGKAGQTWNIFMSDNGVGIFSGTRVSGSNGYFEVRTRTRNRAGSDTISAAANNRVTGEQCRGRATL